MGRKAAAEVNMRIEPISQKNISRGGWEIRKEVSSLCQPP
jgi:hypothetical protein